MHKVSTGIGRTNKYTVMLISMWENVNLFSTKLVRFCKKQPFAMDFKHNKYSQ